MHMKLLCIGTLASQHASQQLPDSSSRVSCSDSSSAMLLTFEMLQGHPGGLFELPEEDVAIDMATRHDVALQGQHLFTMSQGLWTCCWKPVPPARTCDASCSGGMSKRWQPMRSCRWPFAMSFRRPDLLLTLHIHSSCYNQVSLTWLENARQLMAVSPVWLASPSCTTLGCLQKHCSFSL